MWKWLVGALGPRHPLDRELGTRRAVRRFAAELAAQRPAQALARVAEIFEAVAGTGLSLEALVAVDGAAQASRRALSGRLLDSPPQQVLCEGAWEALLRYYRAAAQGYRAVIEAPGTNVGDAQTHALVSVAACRALHALAKHNMLLRMRYREAPGELWTTMQRLVEVAPYGLANPSLRLYPDEAYETSLHAEHLVALMFEMAPNPGLLPAQVHAVDLVLRRFAAELRTGDAYDPERLPFAFDPQCDARPLRWLAGRVARPGLRFFGPGAVCSLLAAERETASGAKATPQWLTPCQISAERYHELLEVLAAHWAPEPPQRRQRREAAPGELLVAHDLGIIRRLAGFAELAHAGRSLDYDRLSAYAINTLLRGQGDAPLPPAAETPSADALRNLEAFERGLAPDMTELWTRVDASDDGTGAEAKGVCAWAKAGMLVAYRHPDDPHWALAVIRWLSRGGHRLRIGMRRLAGTPHVAKIAVNDPRQNAGRAQAAPTLTYDALQLAHETPTLVLPPGVFDPAWRYVLTIGQRWEFVRMQRCTECGLDFEQVAYAIAATQQAA